LFNNARRYTYSGSIKISRDDMKLLKAGRKKCTIRLGLATVATPEIKMSDGRISVAVRIVKVDATRTLKELTDTDARDEGFSSREELLRDLRQYYPRATDSDPITVIYFEPLADTPSLFG
jgi:hypothetical protein